MDVDWGTEDEGQDSKGDGVDAVSDGLGGIEIDRDRPGSGGGRGCDAGGRLLIPSIAMTKNRKWTSTRRTKRKKRCLMLGVGTFLGPNRAIQGLISPTMTR